MSPQRIFVYGSLKRGFVHHAELAGAELLGDARTEPGYALVRQGDYPALVEAPSGIVYGELYAVSDALLAHLDAFEGVPSLYRRSAVRLWRAPPAESYFAARPGAHARIAGGVWRG